MSDRIDGCDCYKCVSSNMEIARRVARNLESMVAGLLNELSRDGRPMVATMQEWKELRRNNYSWLVEDSDDAG
jgi:hypothetical protein